MSLSEKVKQYLTESPNTFDHQMKLLMKDPSKYDDMLSDMKRVHAGKYAQGVVDHYFKDKYHAKLAHDRYKNNTKKGVNESERAQQKVTHKYPVGTRVIIHKDVTGEKESGVVRAHLNNEPGVHVVTTPSGHHLEIHHSYLKELI